VRVGEVPFQLWVVPGLLALLPFAAMGALLALRRSAAPPRLTKVVLLFGGLGAFGMTCLGFSRMTTRSTRTSRTPISGPGSSCRCCSMPALDWAWARALAPCW
jgi:hypothetical protein